MRSKKGYLILLILSVVLIIFISGCIQQESFESERQGENADQVEAIAPEPLQEEENMKETDEKPVLKNFGVNIEPWNKQTNLSGDLIFTKDLIFNDGFINNEKVFLEFGEFEHIINNPDRSVEYWFFLQPGTKVRAAASGIVSVFFIEHTKDWGVNIAPLQSSKKWFVGHEHLVNLEVNDGDIVEAGDILGEAMPHKSFGAELGFTELSVWTGGEDIYKYCPFDFLDESLKPIYEEKINQLSKDWEEFIGKNVYDQEKWVAPGCLVENIKER